MIKLNLTFFEVFMKNKFIKIIKAISATLTISTILIGCSSGGTNNSPVVNQIRLPESISVEVGNNAGITATLDSPAAEDTQIEFTSDDITVALVYPKCTILKSTRSCVVALRGNKLGNATISAADNLGAGATSVATVVSDPTLSLTSPITVLKGSSNIITVTSSQVKDTPVEVIFGSNDLSIATVENSCTIPAKASSCSVLVTGEAVGSAVISASATNYILAHLADVIVSADPTISLTPSVKVTSGSKGSISASIPSTVTLDNPLTVSFGSANNSIASVDSSCVIPANGQSCTVNVTGASVGITSVSASAPGYVLGNVTNVNVESQPTITLTAPSSISINDSQVLQVSVLAAPTAPLTIELNSNDTPVLIVSPSCTIDVGTTSCSAVLKATSKTGVADISASATGYVLAAPAIVTVTSNLTLSLPGSLTLTSETRQILPATISAAETKDVRVAFASSNKSDVTVDPECTIPAGQTQCTVNVIGKVTSEGTLITATARGFVQTNSTSVTVTSLPTFSLNGPSLVRATSTGVIAAKLESGVALKSLTVRFGSSDAATITLNETTCDIPVNGSSCSVAFTAGSESGTSVISASITGYSLVQPQSIKVIDEETFFLTPSSTSVTVGKNTSITAVLPTNATSPTTVSFSSTNTGFVSLDSNSSCTILTNEKSCSVSVLGESVGSAYITATTVGYKLSQPAMVDVTALPTFMLNSISVNKDSQGGSITATLPESVNTVLTVNFSSADTSIATVGSTCSIPSGDLSCSSSVLGKEVGSTSIQAQITGYQPASGNVNVVESDVIFTLSGPNSNILFPGQGYQLTVTLPETESNDKVVQFSTSNREIIPAPLACTITVGSTTCTTSLETSSGGGGSATISANILGRYVLEAPLNFIVIYDFTKL